MQNYNQLYTNEIIKAKKIIQKIKIKALQLKYQKEQNYKRFLNRINKISNLHRAEKADIAGFLSAYLNQITL